MKFIFIQNVELGFKCTTIKSIDTLKKLLVCLTFLISIPVSYTHLDVYKRQDMLIDNAKAVLTEKFIKELHLILKNSTSDSRKDWFAGGDYKRLPNEVGGMETALPEEVSDKMKALLAEYNAKEEKNLEDILDFHVKFERIHPFQDLSLIHI